MKKDTILNICAVLWFMIWFVSSMLAYFAELDILCMGLFVVSLVLPMIVVGDWD